MWLRVFIVGMTFLLLAIAGSALYGEAQPDTTWRKSERLPGILLANIGALLVAIAVVAGVISWARRDAKRDASD